MEEYAKKKDLKRTNKKINNLSKKVEKVSERQYEDRELNRKRDIEMGAKQKILELHMEAQNMRNENTFKAMTKRRMMRLFSWLHKRRKIFIALKLIALTISLVLYFGYGWEASRIVSMWWVVAQYLSLGIL